MRTTRIWIGAALAAGMLAEPARAQNLLTNPDFDNALQLSGWTEQKTWSTDDFADDLASGSVEIDNTSAGNNTILMRQCVPAAPGESFDVSAEIRAASGQSAGAVHFAVVFWLVADCLATSDFDAVGFVPGPDAQETGDWESVSLTGVVAPALTQSAEIQLLVAKTAAGGSLDAHFDHVFLPEPTLALAAAAALASLGALERRSRLRRARAPRGASYAKAPASSGST